MIVSMEYAEDTEAFPRRHARLLKQASGWIVSRFTWPKQRPTDAAYLPDTTGLDRREAMQMARRWVETGEL